MRRPPENKAGKWLAYLFAGALWFAIDLVMQNIAHLDEPFNFKAAAFSALIFTAIASGASDLWRRFVRRDLIGLLIVSALLLGGKIWLFNTGRLAG